MIHWRARLKHSNWFFSFAQHLYEPCLICIKHVSGENMALTTGVFIKWMHEKNGEAHMILFRSLFLWRNWHCGLVPAYLQCLFIRLVRRLFFLTSWNIRKISFFSWTLTIFNFVCKNMGYTSTCACRWNTDFLKEKTFFKDFTSNLISISTFFYSYRESSYGNASILRRLTLDKTLNKRFSHSLSDFTNDL